MADQQTIVPDADPENSEVLVEDYHEHRGPIDDGTLPVNVGDHVVDVEEEDGARMLVTGLPLKAADEYEARDGQTVADFNPDHPADDDVIECTFVSRTDKQLDGKQPYGYPRSRLRLDQPIHQLEVDDGGV